jgi:hypothetical protein
LKARIMNETSFCLGMNPWALALCLVRIDDNLMTLGSGSGHSGHANTHKLKCSGQIYRQRSSKWLDCSHSEFMGRSVTESMRCNFFPAENLPYSWVIPCVICGGRGGTEARF